MVVGNYVAGIVEFPGLKTRANSDEALPGLRESKRMVAA
jgi:hypothetical protein